MARSGDIETLIEDAFLALLPGCVESGVNVIRWDNIKEQTLTPCVKIKATTSTELDGTYNLYAATDLIVDFGVFTARRKDEDGKDGNRIRGQVRGMLSQSNIVAQLNSASIGLSVYNNGVIPETSIDLPDSKVWQKNISVRIVATTQ